MSAAGLSIVLRSWEDRFGARLVGLGHATAFVSVATGPDNADQASSLALQHYLACPATLSRAWLPFPNTPPT